MLTKYRCIKSIPDDEPEVKGANAFTEGVVYEVEVRQHGMVTSENDGSLRFFRDRAFFHDHFAKEEDA